jgi:WD40 repeat protein
VTFWPATGRWPSIFRVAVDQPRDVVFDPNGKWIAAASREGGIEVWPSADNGFPRRRLGLVPGVHAATLALSPDGQFLATGTRSGTVLIVPVEGGGARELRGFEGLVSSATFDATGRRIAANGHVNGRRSEVIRLFDLETGLFNDFEPGDGNDIVTLAFLPDGNLLTSSFGGVRRINVTTGTSELLVQQPGAAFLGPDGRHLLLLRTENPHFPVGTASVFDMQERRSWPLTTHGNQVTLMAWDPSGTRVVTGSRDGTVRVGPATGEEPHLLIGHTGPVWGVRVDPTGRLVASTSEDGTVRIWAMPEGQPLHTLPKDALLDKLRSLTNVRIIADESASTRYRTTFLPFKGWERNPPTW